MAAPPFWDAELVPFHIHVISRVLPWVSVRRARLSARRVPVGDSFGRENVIQRSLLVLLLAYD